MSEVVKISALIDALAVEKGNITAVAKRADVSRTALSLILHGRYKASPAKILRKVGEAYNNIRKGMVSCPALKDEISIKVCRKFTNAIKAGENISGTNFLVVKDVCPYCRNF